MILPYVYKLTHKTTNQFYIGFRKSNKLKSEFDLGFKYFSSSKTIKELGFENFHIEIIAEFFDPKDAYDFEQNLIKENFKNPLILNKRHHADSKEKYNFLISRNMSGENNPMYGISRTGKTNPFYNKTHSTETKNKLRDINLGKKYSISTKIKHSQNTTGENNPKAKFIDIFDSNDNLIYCCKGNFYKICELHKLPKIPLRKSAEQNGVPIFTNKLYHTRINTKFIGWYAKFSSS